jgi:hypothetical protein
MEEEMGMAKLYLTEKITVRKFPSDKAPQDNKPPEITEVKDETGRDQDNN